MSPRFKQLRFLLIILILFGYKYAYSQDISVKNVRYEATAEFIKIMYDLIGTSDEEVIVKVFLKNEADTKFNYEAKKLSGDSGEGKYVGIDKTIYWNYNSEFPNGFEGDQYYFVITAERISTGIPWYIYTGGAVICGAVATYFGLKKDSNSQVIQIPNPPLRPIK